MSLPPVPPRPLSSYSDGRGPRDPSMPPPIPPLPPNFVPDRPDAMLAPRPMRILPQVPADMARNLEFQVPSFPSAMPAPPMPLQHQFSGYGPPQMAPQRYGPSPGPPPFSPGQGYSSPAMASPAWNQPPQPPPLQPWQQNIPQPAWSVRGASPQPPLPQSGPGWSTPGFPAASPMTSPTFPQQNTNGSLSSFTQSFSDLSFSPPVLPEPPRASPQQRTPSPAKGAEPPSVVAPLPTIKTLSASSQSVSVSSDPARKIAWAKQVLALVDRTQATNAANNTKQELAAQIADPELVRLTDTAIQHILNISGNAGPSGPIPPFVAEALYLKGTLSSTGSFPTYLPRDPRSAFKDYETAARAGYAPAWFKLGRDYESVNDVAMAKQCFETGLAVAETSCLYRYGMANLLGQLGLSKNPAVAIKYLRQAADQADLDAPQPAYVYGMILLGEFEQVEIPTNLIMATLPPSTSSNPDPRQSEARRRIERAAYLSFAPAQYKLGWSYEYAKMGCPFDPLLSVQYYSLASQQGETEADMALSKWFLCGSQGAFDKDEILAVTFAEKAAKKGLASAEFAMGYYCEVGVGGAKDIPAAKKWYQRAASHHNEDAVARLKALSQPNPEALSREEHDKLTNTTLVRKRTAAKEFSAANGRGNGERESNGSEINTVKRMAEEERAKQSEPLPTPQPAYASNTPTTRSPKSDQRPLPGPGAGARKQQRPASTERPMSTGGFELPPTTANRGGKRDFSGGRSQIPPVAGHVRRVSPDSRKPGGSGAGGDARPMSVHGTGYSLSDTPASKPSGAAAAGPSKETYNRPQGRQPPSGAPTPPSTTPQPAKKGPATFAEMGFQSAPVEDKDCVIM